MTEMEKRPGGQRGDIRLVEPNIEKYIHGGKCSSIQFGG